MLALDSVSASSGRAHDEPPIFHNVGFFKACESFARKGCDATLGSAKEVLEKSFKGTLAIDFAINSRTEADRYHEIQIHGLHQLSQCLV